MVEKFRGELSFNCLERWSFNPSLFNHELLKGILQKFMVKKFMVEKSGVERPGVEALGWKVRGWNLLQLMISELGCCSSHNMPQKNGQNLVNFFYHFVLHHVRTTSLVPTVPRNYFKGLTLPLFFKVSYFLKLIIKKCTEGHISLLHSGEAAYCFLSCRARIFFFDRDFQLLGLKK